MLSTNDSYYDYVHTFLLIAKIIIFTVYTFNLYFNSHSHPNQKKKGSAALFLYQKCCSNSDLVFDPKIFPRPPAETP